MAGLIQKDYFDALSNGGKNREWFGTRRNRSLTHIRFNKSARRTKRACSKVKTDLNRSESPLLVGRVSIKATDIGASNEFTDSGDRVQSTDFSRLGSDSKPSRLKSVL